MVKSVESCISDPSGSGTIGKSFKDVTSTDSPMNCQGPGPLQQSCFCLQAHDIVNSNGRCEDVLAPTGFRRWLCSLLVMHPTGEQWQAIVCSSWTWLSRSVTIRKESNAYWGDTSKDLGNHIIVPKHHWVNVKSWPGTSLLLRTLPGPGLWRVKFKAIIL